MKADLHTHTFFSDGKYSPSELLNLANKAGFSYLSITDHDNVDGLEEAIECSKKFDIEVISGVEISAEYKGREIHILGYFIDTKNKELLEYLEYFRSERKYRAEKIVEKLNELGIPLSFDTIIGKIDNNVSIGRPHVATALLEGKYIDTYYEAFAKYIGEGRPAYVKKPNISPKEAGKLISNSGGLSFIAHPGKGIKDNVLIEILEQGVDGIEVIHPSHSLEDITYFQKIVSQYFLLESGGSDFHGTKPDEGNTFGTYYISEQKINAMKTRLFKSNN